MDTYVEKLESLVAKMIFSLNKINHLQSILQDAATIVQDALSNAYGQTLDRIITIEDEAVKHFSIKKSTAKDQSRIMRNLIKSMSAGYSYLKLDTKPNLGNLFNFRFMAFSASGNLDVRVQVSTRPKSADFKVFIYSSVNKK